MRDSRRRLFVAGCLLLLFGAAACGKKGPPLPPLRAVPAQAQDLTVRQQGDRLLLELSYPKLTPGGIPLAAISGAEVWEIVRPVPPSAPPAPAAPTTPPDPSAPPAPPDAAPTVPDAKPAPLDPREVAAAAKVRLKLSAADVGAATQGDRLVIELPLPSPPPTPLEAHYLAVRTLGPEGDPSAFSNQVSIVPRAAPEAPAELRLEAKAQGIEVAWSPVDGVAGYAVYRRDSQARTYGRPVHVAGAEERSFLDGGARTGGSYIYTVTSLASRDPVIESVVKSESEVRYLDRFPPPPVANLVALAEAGQVRLIWSPSDAPDLAGYRVYRSDASGEFRLLNPEPVAQPEYTDTSIASGRSYVYRVTAADALGNESEPREVPAVAR